MSSFVETIQYLDNILHCESVECKQYDYKAIQYTGNDLLTVTIDDDVVSENISKIILYTNTEHVGLVCVTLHNLKYNFDLANITTLEVT